MTDTNKNLGVFNYVTGSKDFVSEYIPIIYTASWKHKKDLMGGPKYDLSVFFKVLDEDKHFDVRVPESSYLNIKSFLERSQSDTFDFHRVFGLITNMYDVNVIMSFISDVVEQRYLTYVLCERDGEFLCTNIKISDALCLSLAMNAPVMIRKDIANRISMPKGEFERKVMKRGTRDG